MDASTLVGTFTVPIANRAQARLAWAAVATVCLSVTAFSVWAVLFPGWSKAAGPAVALGALYGWIGFAALRMAVARHASFSIDDRTMTITFDAVLSTPIVVPLSGVRGAVVDVRSDEDRRVAATNRRRGLVAPDFLDPSIPVVSNAQSAHSDDGTAAIPNVVVFLNEPVLAPRVPSGVRLLLKLSTGKYGHYHGPRTGKPMNGIRLAVTAPEAVARALSDRGLLTEPARDARYLAPVTERDRSKAFKHHVTMAAFTAGLIGLLVMAAVFGHARR